MSPEVRTPLEQSREDALKYLHRMIAWGFIPVALFVAGYRLLDGRSPETSRAVVVIMAPMVLSALIAVWLMPSSQRSVMARGQTAVRLMTLLASWGLLMNGPRAANAVAVSIMLTLSVLFAPSRKALAAPMLATVLASLLGVVLRRIGVIPKPSDTSSFAAVYDLSAGALMLMGFAYCTYLFWTTLENYRKGQAALDARTAELLRAQQQSQELLRQEMLARLATTLAGQVAGVLDTASNSWRSDRLANGHPSTADAADVVQMREAGTRATQALRLLESLGRPSSVGSLGADMGAVLQRVEDTLRPIMPFGHTLELHNVSTTQPLVDGARLEQIILYLALQLKPQYGGEGSLVIRVYDGLGDVSRGDGRRTWTIIDIGRVMSHDDGIPESGAAANEGARAARQMLELTLGPLGARLDLETRDGHAFYVLQLPSR